uniref:Uncharacterized protein n=1 Tax=Oryza glumipatula TaxID=40148 RepID=A0A0E0AIJ6_9ORYZ
MTAARRRLLPSFFFAAGYEIESAGGAESLLPRLLRSVGRFCTELELACDTVRWAQGEVH